MDMTTQKLMDRFGQLKTDRSRYEGLWNLLAEFIRPVRSGFTGRDYNVDPDPNIFDGTAFNAQEDFSGGMFGRMVNPASEWFETGFLDTRLMENNDNARWQAEVGRIMLRSFAPAVSGFYGQAPEMIADSGTFGTGVFYSESVPSRQMIYDVCFPLSECWIDQDGYGQVDTLFRQFPMTARAIISRFGQDGMPDVITKAAANGSGDKFKIIHAILPNEEHDPNRAGWRGKPVLSVYILEQGNRELRRGGYDEQPFQVSRWSQPPFETYGQGIGRRVLPDVKMINLMMRDLAIYSNRVADPVKLTTGDDELMNLQDRPGRTIHGGLSDRGEERVKWLAPDGKGLNYVFDHANQLREQIKDAFLFAGMHLTGRTGVSQLETMGRDAQEMRKLAPNQARLQNEWLTPLIARRYKMLERLGQIPAPPDGLDGADLNVVYVSPMAQAQFSAEASSALQLIEAAGALGQLDQGALDGLDGDDLLKTLARGLGAPGTNIRDDGRLQEVRQQRQQQQALQSGLEQGEQGANIIAKIGQAGGAGQQQAAA